MKAMRLHHPVPRSRVLGVSASGYYAELEKRPSKWAQEDARLAIEIRAAHKRTRQSCGPERLERDLAEHGIKAGVCRIKRVRKKLGIRCKQKKKCKAATDSKHSHPLAENLLNQEFETTAPGKIWTTDITSIQTDEGWLYPARHKDLFTGEVVGYAMRARMTKALVMQSLFRVVAAKRPAKGLIHHLDRGSQFCSPKYRKLLEQFGMTASMSRKGNCYDNAPMESFWGALERGLIHNRSYSTKQEAIRELTDYIEVFCSRQRRQPRLVYLSTVAYEQKFYAGQFAA